MKDENLLSSMEDRNEWWRHVFQRVCAPDEVSLKPIKIPAAVLGRILTDADRAVVLKERLDKLRTKTEFDAAVKEANEMFPHRAPVGTGAVSKKDPLCPECHSPVGIHKMDCSHRSGKGLTLSMKEEKAPKPPKKEASIQTISKELMELSQKIRKEYVPCGAEQMATITGEEMLDIALAIKAYAEGLEEQLATNAPPVVYVEEDGDGNVVGVYTTSYANFEYPEGGTQTPYHVKGAPMPKRAYVGECECCGDESALLRGLCHPCTRTYFDDAERELKRIRDEHGGRVWRVVWLKPGTVTTAYKLFWDRESASKFAKELEDKKITVGMEPVEVGKEIDGISR